MKAMMISAGRNRPGRTARAAEVLLAGLVAAFLSLFVFASAPGAPRPSADVPAAIESIRYARGRTLAILANKNIAESSGLAASRMRDGIFWTHNDSGDKPRIYALDRKGRDLGMFDIRGAKARDWEDIAAFETVDRGFLLIGDVGDNHRKRRTCTLYVVPEPTIDLKRRAGGGVKVSMKIDFSYEDGPQNCEALAVDFPNRKIYLLSKHLLPICKVYELPLPASRPGRKLVAKAVATLGISAATGMDISRDGRRAVICNYGEAFEYTRRCGRTWADAFARPPRRIVLPSRRQGESICYGPDDRTLYLTSEKLPTALLEVPPAGPASRTGRSAPTGKAKSP